jgi:hypothetical protein
MDKHQFSPAARSKILSLISPVAAKSKGIFLYTRIIMNNVIILNNMKEIRRELKTLPKDLDTV